MAGGGGGILSWGLEVGVVGGGGRLGIMGVP